MNILTKNPKKIHEEITRQRMQRHDQLAILDSIYETQEKKIDFELN